MPEPSSPTPQNPLLGTFDREAANTRRMLERVPEDRFGWQPHPKSMTMVRLAYHIADLLVRAPTVLATDGIDFAAGGPPRPPAPTTRQGLLAFFDQGVAAAHNAIAGADRERLRETWTARRGEHVLFSMPRRAVLQMQVLHAIHHRGQLSVYLRLNDIPVPGMYGPSADEA